MQKVKLQTRFTNTCPGTPGKISFGVAHAARLIRCLGGRDEAIGQAKDKKLRANILARRCNDSFPAEDQDSLGQVLGQV